MSSTGALMIVICGVCRVTMKFLLSADAQQQFAVQGEMHCVDAALVAQIGALQCDFIEIFGHVEFL